MDNGNSGTQPIGRKPPSPIPPEPRRWSRPGAAQRVPGSHDHLRAVAAVVAETIGQQQSALGDTMESMTDLSRNGVQWDDKAVELLASRARQRRVLDDIPAFAIEQYRPPLSQGVIPSSAPFVAESELRKLADEQAGSLQELLARFAEAAAGNALWEVLHHESSQKEFDFHIFQLQLERAADRRARAHVNNIIDGDERMALRRLIAYLVWADELAGDYQDARL
jgi:hypothetical protein